MRACVSMYTRVHVPIPRRAIQSVGKTREDSRIHTHARGRTGVNYASREMSNCSPYHKIYNSTRCGKHYVLSRSSSSLSPLAIPPSATRCPHRPPSHESFVPLFPFSSSFLTPALPSRFANKFARRTAVVLTSRRFRRPLPEIHFSVGRDIMSPRCNGETVTCTYILRHTTT